jgi:allantoinase
MDAQGHKVVVGRVKQADGNYARGAVWIEGGTITDVSAGSPEEHALGGGELVDVGDSFVLPGAVDAHVHCYSHDGEGLRAGTTSAAAGGVTTIVEMPFDAAAPVNTVDRLRAKQQIVADEAVVDVALLGTLAPGGGWRQAEALADAGVVGFKVSLYDTHPVRFPRIDDAELLDVMAAVADVDRTLCVHAENNEIVQHLSRVGEGSDPFDPLTHVRTRPPVTESLGALTAMEIAHDRGGRLHLCHMSIPRAVRLASWYREEGTDVSLETCPHYLSFTADDMATAHGRLKINPPLRGATDRDGLWRGIGDGLVPVISSDHAPWPLELKIAKEILKNASGVPGVETLAAVSLGGALERDPDPSGLFDRVVDALTIGPATRFGFGHRKGRIEKGYDADLMIFTPDSGRSISAEEQHSNAGWTPYDGFKPGGYVSRTYSHGELVWDSQSLTVAQPGRGQLITVG